MINLIKKYEALTMVIAMAFWGTNWTCAKLLEPMMPISTLVFYRFFFAALGFLPIILIQKQSFRIPKKAIWPMVVCSILMGLYQYLFFKGIHAGFAGAGGVLVTTLNPIITFALVALLKRRWLHKKEWLGLGLGAISAVFFLQLWTLSPASIMDHGNLYFLGAACSWAILTIMSQYIELPTLIYNFYAFALVAPLFALKSSWGDILSIITQPVMFWINIGFIAIFGTVFSTTFYFYIAQNLGAKKAASYIFLVPAMALTTSFFILHEKPSSATLIGGGLALTGVYILNRKDDGH